MERMLPDDAFIVGVDEHTAVVLDLDARTATVSGIGGMTIRRRGQSIVHPSGSTVTFEQLASDSPDVRATGDVALVSEGAPPISSEPAPGTLAAEADRLSATFGVAAQARDVETCVGAALELEQLLTDWSSDLSDDVGYAHAVLRQMVVRLGDLADAVDPMAIALPPVMDLVIDVRRSARDARDFRTADSIRDRLGRAGIEIRDTPDGATWRLLAGDIR
jgi:hypothetical protein